MAKYVIDGPKHGIPDSAIKPEAPAIKREERLGEHEYYGGDVLSAPESGAEARGEAIVEKGREAVLGAVEHAQARFGSFFGGLREKAERIAERVGRAFNVSVGVAAEAAGVAGKVAVEAAKVPYIAAEGTRRAVVETVLPEAKAVIAGNVELAKKGARAVGAGAREAAATAIAGGLEAAMWVDEKARKAASESALGEDIKEMGEGLAEGARWAASPESGEALTEAATDVGRSMVEAAKVGVRGAKKVGKGAAIAGAVVGGVGVGAAAVGATAALGVGYGVGTGMEAAARFGMRKAGETQAALGAWSGEKKQQLDAAINKTSKEYQAAKNAAVMAGSLAVAEGAMALAQARELARGAKAAVAERATGLKLSAEAKVANAKIGVEQAVGTGLAATVDALEAARDGITVRMNEAKENARKDLERARQDVEMGADRLNTLYDNGVQEYGQFQTRVTKARSAWSDFMNAGRSALDSFTSIFKSRGEKKKQAERIVAAMDAQRELDALEANGE